MSIVDAALEEAHHRGGLRISAVYLKVGPLSGVVPEALCSAFEMACADTELEGCRLLIEDVPPLVDCPVCGTRRPLRSIQHFCCDACGTPTAHVVQGRELELTALEVES